jgi:hypothetical protein
MSAVIERAGMRRSMSWSAWRGPYQNENLRASIVPG